MQSMTFKINYIIPDGIIKKKKKILNLNEKLY